ncbi:MAG: anaerobic ribonucleoside-triphosphate reductase, partial [bacterium]
IGMNEVGLNANWLRADLTHKEVQDFVKKTLNHMREKLSDYQEEYGDLYNLEATPAESTTYRFAKKDKELYPEIITATEDGNTPYYTNSSHLPVSFTDDIFDALDIQDELQTLYTSGTVFHAFLGEKLPNWEGAATLVRKIAENYKLPYYTISPTYSICQDHGYIKGEQHICPICGRTTEIWSRITGYYRPVQNWNEGKVQEYKERKEYDIGHSVLKGRDVKSIQIVQEIKKPETMQKLYLFTTKTCPNCRIVKKMLANAGVEYELVDAEENEALTKRFSVMQAPTLIVADDKSYAKYANASNIRKFIETTKA